MKTQVAIIGGGPSGLLLSQMLDQKGIESVVLERRSRDYVLSRIRAGVLEWGSVDILKNAGVGTRLEEQGKPHDAVGLAWSGKRTFYIDTKKYTDRPMMAYGQTQITEDLYKARNEAGGEILHEVDDVDIHDVTTNKPFLSFQHKGKDCRLACDFVAGCDGFHGVSRNRIPKEQQRSFEKAYPFGWLGIMSETPPLEHIVYATHERGFALASQRNPHLSRYYIQVDDGDTVENWSDDRFWTELKHRFPEELAEQIVTGPTIEKSIAPLRSFVSEPMQWGRLFLAGDAAHIVPPTGAKGLNLAISDVYYLSRAITEFYQSNTSDQLDLYSQTALKRVWGAARFSWWLTTLMHRFPDQTEFEMKTRETELDYLANSEAAQKSMCEQYAGLPLD